MNKLLQIIFLIIIILIALFTRIYKLGQSPPGLYLDEAAQGYNAYSILKTGKDEFGKNFPIVFRSFADFKTPIYIYLIVPLIPLFGLTPFAVRFPAFFFGLLNIPLLFLLVKYLAPKKYNTYLALISSLVLAISPWHILFSRADFESTIALFFLCSGLYVFYLSLSKPKLLIFSSMLLAISFLAYHAERFVTPIIVLALIISYWNILVSKSHYKYFFIGIAAGFVLLIPTITIAFTPGFFTRAAGVNIFSFHNQLPTGYLNNYTGHFSVLLNNTYYISTREFLTLYMSYFSPRNLFSLGDYDQRTSYPGIATFFIWEFPFYVLGLYWFVKTKLNKKFKFLTFLLLLISPIPAAITRDPYTTIRSLQMVIPLCIIIAFGIYQSYEKIKIYWINKHLNKYLLGGMSLFALITVLSYSLAKIYSSVFILNDYYKADKWNYGFDELSRQINLLDPLLPIVFDSARIEPYSELLFYLNFDPHIYQQQNFEVSTSDYYTNLNRNKNKVIGNIETRGINWELDTSIEKYLVGDALSISDNQIINNRLTLIKKIYYPDKSVAFIITKTNP
jgi:4-amino-4-deoxy-L-arabinose transferase-like glycosyltransferase